MKKATIKSQAGYTMIELSIGVTIVALVIAGIVAGAQRLADTVGINKTTDQVANALQNTKLYVKRDANAARATLEEMTKPTSNAFAMWAVSKPGTSQAAATSALGNGAQLYAEGTFIVLRLLNVSGTSCPELSSNVEGLADQLYINGTVVKNAVTSFTSELARTTCLVTDNYLTIQVRR